MLFSNNFEFMPLGACSEAVRPPLLKTTGLVRPCAEAKPYPLGNQNGLGRSPSLNQNGAAVAAPLARHQKIVIMKFL